MPHEQARPYLARGPNAIAEVRPSSSRMIRGVTMITSSRFWRWLFEAAEELAD